MLVSFPSVLSLPSYTFCAQCSVILPHASVLFHIITMSVSKAAKQGKDNKSAQSKLGRGPRRGAVGHVRRKVPIGYNGAPQIRLKKYPFPWTDPQTPLYTCLIPGPARPTMPNRIRSAVFPHCTGQTDRSSAGKFGDYRPLRCESDQPNNRR